MGLPYGSTSCECARIGTDAACFLLVSALRGRETVANVCGVILAGGKASRMGGTDKGALVVGDRTLFDRVIDRFGPQVDRLALNANGDLRRFEEYSLTLLPDSVVDQPGPLAGVLAGMDWAARMGCQQVITVAVDTPFVPNDLVMRLHRGMKRANTPIALAATECEGRLQRHPTCGIWSVRLREDLRSALAQGVRKVTYWADSHGAASVLFEPDAFFNINTPDDLATAEEMLKTSRL